MYYQYIEKLKGEMQWLFLMFKISVMYKLNALLQSHFLFNTIALFIYFTYCTFVLHIQYFNIRVWFRCRIVYLIVFLMYLNVLFKK